MLGTSWNLTNSMKIFAYCTALLMTYFMDVNSPCGWSLTPGCSVGRWRPRETNRRGTSRRGTSRCGTSRSPGSWPASPPRLPAPTCTKGIVVLAYQVKLTSNWELLGKPKLYPLIMLIFECLFFSRSSFFVSLFLSYQVTIHATLIYWLYLCIET